MVFLLFWVVSGILAGWVRYGIGSIRHSAGNCLAMHKTALIR